MGIFSRSIDKNLADKYKKANAASLAALETTPNGKQKRGELEATAAAQELVRDGFSALLQGQMVMRERGVALTANAKANFGALIAPKLLKLEAGVSLSGAALGKKTILVMRGRTEYTVGSAVTPSPHPIMIACLDGWKFEGGAGVTAAVGVGGKLGTAGVGLEREKAKAGEEQEGFKFNPEAKSKPTENENTPGKIAFDTVKAEASWFAGAEGALSISGDRYYATDAAPMFLANDADTSVMKAIQETLEQGSVKSAIKDRACQFITKNAALFGGALKYDRGFFGGGHTGSETIAARLAGGIAGLPESNANRKQAESFLRQLRPYMGFRSDTHGLTHIYICGGSRAASGRIGATVEGAASVPMLGVSFGAKVEANLANVAWSRKSIELRFQAPVAMSISKPTQVYTQNFDVKYTMFRFALLEASFNMSASALGREYTLGEFVDGKLDARELGAGSEFNQHERNVADLVEALGSFWALEKGEGISGAIRAKGASTMSYKGVTMFWNRPSDADLTASSGKLKTQIEVDAHVGTGYVAGMTFTLSTLAKTADILRRLKAVVGSDAYTKLYQPGGLTEADVRGRSANGTVRPADSAMLAPLNQFATLFAGFAISLGVSTTELADFIEDFGDLAHGMAIEVGGGTGVLIEACFSVPEALREKLIVVEIEANEGGPTLTPTKETNAKIINAVQGVKADSIRLRHRMADSFDRSLTIPLGVTLNDFVDVGVNVKNVWNLEVEGIPTFFEHFIAKPEIANVLDPNVQRMQVVPPPLLFRC
jgi:hypothetical protein